MNNSLTEIELQKQIARVKALPRGDRPWGVGKKGDVDYESGLRDELFKALWQQACSNEHATRIIDRVLEACKFCPTPADVVEIAVNVPADLEADKQGYQLPNWGAPPGKTCTVCKGSAILQREDGKWERCACGEGRDFPQRLLDLQNSYEAKKAIPKSEPRPVRPLKNKGSLRPVTQEEMNAVLNRALAGFKERTR